MEKNREKMNEFDQMIIDLALKGLSNQKVADILNGTDEAVVEKVIKNLNNPKHPNYNPTLYNQILIEKSLSHNIIDKDLIDVVIKMILDNYLPIEVGIMNDLTQSEFNRIIAYIKYEKHFSIELINKIKNKLNRAANLDSNLKYKRIAKLEKKYPNIKLEDYGYDVSYYRRWQINFLIIEDFLYNGLDISSLALKYDVVKCTIRNLLLGLDPTNFIKENYNKETCEKIKELYYSQVEVNKNNSNIYRESTLKKSNDYEIINYLCKNSRFWIMVLLTYRLSINDLATMFKITDVKVFRNRFLNCVANLGNKYLKALEYLDVNSNPNNINKAFAFYLKYKEERKNNPVKAKLMLKLIDDSDYINLMKQHKSIEKMSDEEHQIIAKYWVKYALPIRSFSYNHATLDKYCLSYYEEEINKIKEYNKENFNNYYRKRKLREKRY